MMRHVFRAGFVVFTLACGACIQFDLPAVGMACGIVALTSLLALL